MRSLPDGTSSTARPSRPSRYRQENRSVRRAACAPRDGPPRSAPHSRRCRRRRRARRTRRRAHQVHGAAFGSLSSRPFRRLANATRCRFRTAHQGGTGRWPRTSARWSRWRAFRSASSRAARRLSRSKAHESEFVAAPRSKLAELSDHVLDLASSAMIVAIGRVASASIFNARRMHRRRRDVRWDLRRRRFLGVVTWCVVARWLFLMSVVFIIMGRSQPARGVHSTPSRIKFLR